GQVRLYGHMRRVPVVDVMWSELVMPPQLTGVGIDRYEGAGVEIVAIPIVAIVVGIGIAGSVEHEIERRVVTAGHPDRSATAGRDLGIGPRLAARLAGQWNCIETPQALSAIRIVGIDVAAAREVSPGHADNHFIFDDERRCRDGIRILEIAHRYIPD